MANSFSTNFAIPSSSNFFQVIWRLSRVMKAAGWLYKASGDGTSKDTSGTAGNDLWGGNANPLNDTYAGLTHLSDTSAGWWVASGPQTVRMTITAAPTGAPLRGEVVTQTTSGATGELIGYVFDTTSNTGWMVIGIQTGTFDGTHTITGNISGCSFTPAAMTTTVNASGTLPQATITVVSTIGFPSAGTITVVSSNGNQTVTYTGTTATTFTGCTGGTGNIVATNAVTGANPVTYNREIVLGKPANDTVDGTIYYICADSVAELASLFSSLSTQTGCTATVWPGGGGTSNGFPTKAICVRGNGGNITGSDGWVGYSSLTFGAHAQIACANATAATNVTGDGSFYIAASTSTVNNMSGFMFTRLDDTEPGDIDPYIWMIPQGTNTFSSYSRTIATSFNSTYYWALSDLTAGSTYGMMGYQARGVGIGGKTTAPDVAMGYSGTFGYDNFGGGYAISPVNTGANLRSLNNPATSAPVVREPMLVYTGGQAAGTQRQTKGRTRWLMATSIGASLDTFDTKTWLAVISLASNIPCIMLGPYDGTSTPSA